MRASRWSVVPAALAGIFITLAIVPPLPLAVRGLRVETLGAATVGRALLLRASVEDRVDSRWRAPRAVRFTVRAANGAAVIADAHAVRGASHAFARVTPAGPGPYTVRAVADGMSADGEISPRAPPTASAFSAQAPVVPEHIDVIAEGGALVPEVPASLLVRAASLAGASAQIVPDPTLEALPSQRVLDACGAAEFTLTPRGLGASVELRFASAPARSVSRRLDVIPGGLSAAPAPHGLALATAVGEQPVYVVGGDEQGPTYWAAEQAREALPDQPRSTVVVPGDVRWAVASTSPTYEGAVGLWLATPANAPCTATPLGERLARASTPVPSWGEARLVVDGAALAVARYEARRARARVAALVAAVGCVGVLVALVLRAGLRPDPAGIRSVADTLRRRVLLTLALASVLAIAGLAMMVSYLLRS